MTGYILLILLALILEAFFSGSETAMVSCNRMRIRALYEEGNRSARIIWNLLQNPHRLLSTTLVGTNLCVVTESVLVTSLCVHFFRERGPLIAILIVVPIALVFGEMLPKVVFRLRANQILLKVAPGLVFFQKILFPAVAVVGFLANTAVRGLGIKRTEKSPFLTKEDIKLLVQEIAREGILEDQEEETISRIFKFRHIMVSDVMVTMDKIISIDYNYTKAEIEEKARRYGFTRFPVFENKKLKGVVNIFDLFYHEDDWHNHIRPLRHTYTNQRIDRLFSQMKPNKETMSAVMRNEKLVSIVTMEDIMEEIVLPEMPRMPKGA